MSQAGLAGVTLGVLAEQVGMSKSGLFAHFRSKEDAQIELLKYLTEFVTAQVIEPAISAGEGLPRLRALVRNWFGWAPRAGLPGGCPLAAALFEFDDVEGRVRDKILELEGEFRRWLTGLVKRAVELGHLRHDLDVEQFVWELCAIYLGHHAANRFLRSADVQMRANLAFKALLARAMRSGKRRAVAKRTQPGRPRRRRKGASQLFGEDR